jgi:hypothetical protein
MEDNSANSAKENYTVALSGMIMGAVSLLCAFIPAWRGFAIILGVVSLVVCIFALARSGAVHSKKMRSFVGIGLAVCGIAVGAMYKYMKPSDNAGQMTEPVPTELKDTQAIEQDNTNSLEKLQGITDSSNVTQ